MMARLGNHLVLSSLLLAALLTPRGVRAQAPGDEYLNSRDKSANVARLWKSNGNRKLAIILPPYGGTQNYYDSSKLPGYLAERGIDFAVLFTEVTGYNQPSDITRLDALIKYVVEKHHYDKDKIVLGGFSAGGYGAFRYALLKLKGSDLAILPKALISVDAPMDIERWYNGMDLVAKRTDAKNPFHGECKYLTQMFREMFDGSPKEHPQAYWDHSVFTASKPDGGNATYFKAMPVRLYSEPDMTFFVEYGIDYTSTNAADQVSLASILKLQGNKDVSLVLTSGKGYRAELDNMRLPHSWSIVDEKDLAEWIARYL
jgi:pimeloyl-ACP methyl ester carboxylesterase